MTGRARDRLRVLEGIPRRREQGEREGDDDDVNRYLGVLVEDCQSGANPPRAHCGHPDDVRASVDFVNEGLEDVFFETGEFGVVQTELLAPGETERLVLSLVSGEQVRIGVFDTDGESVWEFEEPAMTPPVITRPSDQWVPYRFRRVLWVQEDFSGAVRSELQFENF